MATPDVNAGSSENATGLAPPDKGVLGALAAFSWVSALAALLVVLFAGYLLWDRFDLAPATRGAIFVETPQIYTRERLVNDRFVQDSWLKAVLREEPQFSPSMTERSTRKNQIRGARGASAQTASGATGEDPAGTLPPGGQEGDPGSQPAVPPPLKFLLRNAYRELIRSHLIENQLDDRHDIRGTTIYMMKFDVSIVPGTNTRERAYFQVKVRQTDSADAAPSGASAQAMSAQFYFEYYVRNQRRFARLSQDATPKDEVMRNYELYTQWIQALQERLNANVADTVRRFFLNGFRYREYEGMLAIVFEKNRAASSSHWFNLLAQLRYEYERLKNEHNGPTFSAFESRFHVLAKNIVLSAIHAESAPNADLPDAKQITDELGGSKTLTKLNEVLLHDDLVRYAVRNAGIALFNDTSFRVESLGSSSDASGRGHVQEVIRSKMLDSFVTLTMQRGRASATPDIQIIERKLTLFSMQLEEVQAIVQDKSCKTVAENRLGYGFFDYYAMLGSYTLKDNEGKTLNMGVYRVPAEDDTQFLRTPDADIPSYLLTPANLAIAFGEVRPHVGFTPYGDCLPSARSNSLPVGFFLFADKIRDVRPYTYATLPRLDVLVSDSASDSSRSDSLKIQGEASGSIENYYRRIVRAVEPKTSIVGYSGSNSPSQLDFGWVFSPSMSSSGQDRSISYLPMQPTQRSLSALITVPTWWDKASIHIDSGWVDHSGTFVRTATASYTVPLPIDFEALDGIVTQPGRRDSRRPALAFDRLPDRMDVQACEKADLVIPGYRLWRGTMVALGEQVADQVTVLPDMRGIIASFSQVNDLGSWERDVSHRTLHVWTSEGVTATVPVIIYRNRKKTVCGGAPPSPPASTASAGGTQAAGQ